MLTETALVLRVVSPDAPGVSLFSRIEVHRDAAAVAEAWAELENATPCSIYQTRAWLMPWIETLGRKAGIAPLFVVTRDKTNRCLALFCLGVAKRGPLRVATWLGGSDSNFNMPLLRSDIDWTTNDVARLLRKAAKACGDEQPDVFALVNQPLEWHGRSNPLAVLHHYPSPSDAYGTALGTSAEALFAEKFSKDTRKKLRKKEERLAATLGPLTHLVVAGAEEQRRVIEAFLAQKLARFRAQKIVSEFDTPEMRAFIEAATPPNGSGIELHALLAGERIVAVYGGAAHGGQWSGMFNAFDGDEEIAKSSPGDLLLMRIVGKAIADGLERFDLGVGEARYKAALCDTPIPLFDTFFPLTFRGSIAAYLVAWKQRVKRWIKRNPRLFAFAKRIKALGMGRATQ